MTSELLILNKYMKKLFPFILEVDSVYLGEEVYDPFSYTSTFNYSFSGSTSISSRRDKTLLKINIYVSPLHYCELMDCRVEKKITNHIYEGSSALLKSIITSWNGEKPRILFFPSVGKSASILDGLDITNENTTDTEFFLAI